MQIIRRLLASSLGVLAAAAVTIVPAAAQKPGGTLVQITQPEPPNLASYISTSGPIGQVTAKVFDGLLEYGFDLKPQPALAESFEVAPDGKTITFKLRDNVKFHDGKPLTSADIAFTFMDVLKKVHPRGIATFRELTAVETPDAKTAIFKLAQPAPYMLMAFSGYESPILPKHVYGEGDIKPIRMPTIRSAPVRSSSWNGAGVSLCASTRTRITGARACHISIVWSSGSSRIARRVQRRLKKARRTSQGSALFPITM